MKKQNQEKKIQFFLDGCLFGKVQSVGKLSKPRQVPKLNSKWILLKFLTKKNNELKDFK